MKMNTVSVIVVILLLAGTVVSPPPYCRNLCDVLLSKNRSISNVFANGRCAPGANIPLQQVYRSLVRRSSNAVRCPPCW